MKEVGFTAALSAKILAGEKTSTIRLQSENRFVQGERVVFVNSDTGEAFGEAILETIYTKPLGELDQEDLRGNEPFPSTEAMLSTFRGFYGDEIDHRSPATVVRFLFTPIDLPS